MWGKAEKTEIPRPLHRLTGLRDDVAAQWLSTGDARKVWFLGVLAWTAYSLALYFTFVVLPWALLGPLFRILVSRLQLKFAAGVVGALLFPFVRRFIVRFKNGRMQNLVRATVAQEAIQVDDWGDLGEVADGQAISIVGWARKKLTLARLVGKEPAIGIGLSCVQSFEGVLESVHDFDLVDEEGRVIPVAVAGGRVIGEPNFRVFTDDDGRMLVSSLDLPAGAMPTGDALVLRDGDPLMVVGFKASVVDPSMSVVREAPVRITVTSSQSRPLLIYPIAAERRPSTGFPPTGFAPG